MTLYYDPTDPTTMFDPLSFGEAWAKSATAVASDPNALAYAGARYFAGLVAASSAAGARALGRDVKGPLSPDRSDRRFGHAAWEQHPGFFALLQAYLLSGRMVEDVLDAAEIDAVTAHRMDFLADIVMGAVAPTNFFWTNPAAREKAFQTGGASVVRGLNNFVSDLRTNKGLPRHVVEDAFEVGKDLAVTPGKVVFRNDLMELIQYTPRTETVYATPLLMSPPWINKYYIMDLAPGRSFVEWAVDHGHTVFTISYRNPGAEDRHVRLDDYLLSGPIAALDTIREITGAEKANIVGLCLGGTLTAALLAYLDSRGEDRIATATLLNTLVDFSEPGQLGAFTDKASVERLEKRMESRGFLDASEMMGIFTFMRSNDLVWSYVVNNWLLGQDPPAFDILSWNGDSTNLPAEMHSFYLRSCYLHNELVRGQMELAGTVLDLETVRNDLYVVGAIRDHIAPWQGSYMTTQVLPNAPVRYVLSASGHIAGIVNPPSKKTWMRTGQDQPADPEEWLAASTLHEATSWWEDWADWLGARSGERVPPPPMGSAQHPVLGDAPGEYVLEK